MKSLGCMAGKSGHLITLKAHQSAQVPAADSSVYLRKVHVYAGVIPANLTRKIPVLELQNNWFNVTPSSWFGSRAYTGSDWYLIRADMSGNNLTGLFPDGLAKQAFKPVKYLDVSGNQLRSVLLAHFLQSAWHDMTSWGTLQLSLQLDAMVARGLTFQQWQQQQQCCAIMHAVSSA